MRRRAESLALAAFVVLQIALVLHHEPWRDEAETWLIARDASPAEIWNLMPYAGTPSLWYVPLVPLARLGFPFAAQQWLHAALAAIAGGILLFRSPFPRVIRILALFGYYFSFEYAAVSRHYALTGLFLFLLASFYGRRNGNPALFHGVIGLLANVNAHSFLLAAVLLAFEAVGQLRKDTRRAWAPFLLSSSGLALALFQLWPPEDGWLPPGAFIGFDAAALSDVWAGAFLPDHFGALATASALLLVAVSLVAMWRRRRIVALLLSGWAVLLYVFAFKYVTGLRHYGLVFLWFVFCLWIAQAEDPAGWTLRRDGGDRVRRFALLVFAASLIVSTSTAVRYWWLEYRFAFSEGKEMARFIERSGLSSRSIAAHPAPNATSVLAQLPKRTFWYPGIREDGSHMNWNRAYAEGLLVPRDEILRRVATHFGESTAGLLLLNEPLADPAARGWSLLHATPGRIFAYQDERFFLYERLRAP